MKKRLLSLLLAMAMIVSMVPFQALAEEPDETPPCWKRQKASRLRTRPQR